jgi:Spx/MgsR family transcriptional regulator
MPHPLLNKHFTMTVTLFGIKNCDTMKKAMQWLNQHQIDYQFHDYKKQGLSADYLKQWLAVFSLDDLINKRGTTWRKLDDSVKQSLNPDNAIPLLLEHTSMIKRPLLQVDDQLYLGFKPEEYAKIFNR